MKILNGYAGVGGNRKAWDPKHRVTAVELNPAIAYIYYCLYPQDRIVIADAHEYLLEHYKEIDFIWMSPHLDAKGMIRNLYELGYDIIIASHRNRQFSEIIKMWLDYNNFVHDNQIIVTI